MGFDSKRGNTTGFAFFVSDADGIRHKIWIRHEIWKHNRLWFLCRMLTGSDTKLGNTIGFVFFCVGCWWDPTQNLATQQALFFFCVGCWWDPTQNLETHLLLTICVSDLDVIRHKIWKQNWFGFLRRMPSWSDTTFGNTKLLWVIISCWLKSSFNKNQVSMQLFA